MPWAIVGEARTVEELQSAMEATHHANVAVLKSGTIPPLYLSGVVYERETRANIPKGVERFQTARDAYMLGHSDCDGLAPWKSAENVVAGRRSRPKVVPSSCGYHVIVENADGTREDPSARLGMLDGFDLVGDDARPTARARRRRMVARLTAKAERLIGQAARQTGAPQRESLAAASRLARVIRGHETQMHADGEPPITDHEVEAAGGESVDGRHRQRRGR
jgi:hypothetical protein